MAGKPGPHAAGAAWGVLLAPLLFLLGGKAIGLIAAFFGG